MEGQQTNNILNEISHTSMQVSSSVTHEEKSGGSPN